jgi:competence protein ComEC
MNMPGHLKAINTRFRAYQLGQAGASFSYMAGNHFTLIEAVATDISKESIKHELDLQQRTTIDDLHITSWDSDHCSPPGLDWILQNLQPEKIEFPGYEPHCDRAIECLKMIQKYESGRSGTAKPVKLQRVNPTYVLSLDPAEGLGYNNIFYHPKKLVEGSNDNSTVKFFRAGSFNVLSLGDVENANIGSMLRASKILCNETDVMILAHHGADNDVTTKKFLSHIDPSVCVCNSNYDNQYDHPSDAVRQRLYEKGICLYTTKTGDVVIQSAHPHARQYEVINYKANSTEISSRRTFEAKKARLLSSNADTIRNLYHPGFKGIRR